MSFLVSGKVWRFNISSLTYETLPRRVGQTETTV